MKRYPEDAWERAVKVQEVILRARAKRIIPRGGTSGGDFGDLRAPPAALVPPCGTTSRTATTGCSIPRCGTQSQAAAAGDRGRGATPQ